MRDSMPAPHNLIESIGHEAVVSGCSPFSREWHARSREDVRNAHRLEYTPHRGGISVAFSVTKHARIYCLGEHHRTRRINRWQPVQAIVRWNVAGRIHSTRESAKY